MPKPKFKNMASIPWKLIDGAGNEVAFIPPGAIVKGEQYFEFMRLGAPLKFLSGPIERDIEEPAPERRPFERQLRAIEERERRRNVHLETEE